MKPQVKTAIVLDERRAKKDGTFPAKLRLTHKGKQRYIPTGRSFTNESFEAAMTTKNPKKQVKEDQIFLRSIEAKAIDVLGKIPAYSFNRFKIVFLGPDAGENDAFNAITQYSAQLRKEAREGTAQLYDKSLKSFNKFHPGATLPYSDITPEWLQRYENWMLENGNSLTTVGIQLRNLRAIFNKAIKANITHQEFYPFGKGKYTIPAGRNVKKALKIEELKMIFNYETIEGTSEDWARDMWVFSYLSNGQNIKDICRLKYSNIEGDSIVFVRAKTARTTRENQKPIIVNIHPRAQEIIDKWGKKPVHPDAYIFGILTPGVTPKKEIELVKLAGRKINTYMRRIAAALGITQDITTYTARHCWASISLFKGAPIEYISEGLGHANLETTQNYIASFPKETRKKFSQSLTDW